MKVVFVHGWSVQHTDTYGALPTWLGTQSGPDGTLFSVENVYLGKYISFDDTVTVDDIARAFNEALGETLGKQQEAGERFAAITHSTGGPVVRTWLDLYWKGKLDRCPLSHLVMLAPANHGSALAQLGKGRLSRIKNLFQGGEPGERVLDWLELRSDGSWTLNKSWLNYDCVGNGVFPFVLTGQRIDRKLYDALNSYTGEPGSDGVVRVASANMNYGFLRLVQKDGHLRIGRVRHTTRTAFGVLPGLSHSGEDMGIMRGVNSANAEAHVTAQWLLRCLKVKNATQYNLLAEELHAFTSQTQLTERTETIDTLFGTRTYENPRHTMVVLRILDDRGEALSNYDFYLTAGPDYSDDELPPGFFSDRQKNRRNVGTLTYFLNYDALDEGLQRAAMGGKLGFRLQARPEEQSGKPKLVFYRTLDFRRTARQVSLFLVPNETLLLEVQLQRCVDATVFRIEKDLNPSPIDAKPSENIVSD